METPAAHKPPAISIIIMTLNEEELIGGLLLSLRGIENTEIIISDGGSIDRTCRVASKYTEKIIRGERGRGKQLNAGAALATGDILWFLHVDSTPPDDFKKHILKTLEKPGVAGGAFTLEIDSDMSSLKFISRVVELRSLISRVPYGDQGIFVRRDVFEEMNGFKNIPLMEDIEFCRRLKKKGRIEILKRKIKTCARAWEKHGVLRTTLRNWAYVTLFFMGYSPYKLHERYYRKNIKHTMQRDEIKKRKDYNPPVSGIALK